MQETFSIAGINISREKGTVKSPTDQVIIDKLGIVGDAHRGPWHRGISLLAMEAVTEFCEANNLKIGPGEFGENILTLGLNLDSIAPFDILEIGKIRLEVTQIGKKCHGDKCAIYRKTGQCIMPNRGIFARVLNGGELKIGDSGKALLKSTKIMIITLSDRVYNGQNQDKSGPLLAQLIRENFKKKRWRPEISSVILPDDKALLEDQLKKGESEGFCGIFITGGTGIGPRDITPETVSSFSDKIIPGIMENIRFVHGQKNPAARLSRSIAGIKGKIQIYALPGSPKAVEEYIPLILDNFDHIRFMLEGIDNHQD